MCRGETSTSVATNASGFACQDGPKWPLQLKIVVLTASQFIKEATSNGGWAAFVPDVGAGHFPGGLPCKAPEDLEEEYFEKFSETVTELLVRKSVNQQSGCNRLDS